MNFHLPTTYKDFINVLSSLEETDVYDLYNLFLHSFVDYNNLIKNYNNFDFDKNKIEKLINLTKSNLWFQFFKKELEIETWIDFENKIEYVLENIFSSLTLLKKAVFNINREHLSIYNLSTLDTNIEHFEILNFFNLISIQDKINHIWIFNPKFTIKKYDYFIDINSKKFFEFLENDLNQFKEIFNLYFSVFILPLYNHYKFDFDKKYFKNINYYFTFNYTPTFEKFHCSKIESHYLHGKIDSEKNNIVLGINDIPDDFDNKIYFLPFTKYYQKLNNNTDYHFLNQIDLYQQNYMFFFFGHSLDKSDEDYINEVFDFISNKKSKKSKIVVIYHNDDAKSKLLLNLLHIRGKKDIVEKMRKKTLVFCKMDSSELKKELELDISNFTPVIL